MPSTSSKQARFMAAIAHSKEFADKVGVSQSVGKEFNKADKAAGATSEKKPKYTRMYAASQKKDKK